MIHVLDPVALAAVAATGVAGAVVDLYTRRVPNVLTFGTAALGLLLAGTHQIAVTPTAALAGIAVGLAIMLPGHLIGATGAGDVKFLAALGAMLGPERVLFAFVYMALAGGALAALVAIRRRQLRDTLERTAIFVRTRGANLGDIEQSSTHNRFAYAPAIALGALAAVLGL